MKEIRRKKVWLKKSVPIIVIISLIGLFGVIQGVWNFDSERFPIDPEHITSALKYYHCLARTDIGKTIRMLHIGFRPPLVYLLTAPIFSIFGPSLQSALLSLTFWFGGLLIVVYMLGRIFGAPRAGLLACYLTTLFLCFKVSDEAGCFHYFFPGEFMVDIPLAAMVTLTILLIIMSSKFSNCWASLAAGTVFGMGMLIKLTFPLYAGPPLIYAVWISRCERRQRHNASRSLIIAGAIYLSWLAINLFANAPYLWSYIRRHLSSSFACDLGHPAILSLKNWYYYPALLSHLMTPPVFFILLFFLIRAIVRRESKVVVLTVIASSLLLFFLPGRSERPIVPLLPLCAIIIGVQWARIETKWLRRILLTVLVFAPLWRVCSSGLPDRFPASTPSVAYQTIGKILEDISGMTEHREITPICILPTTVDFSPFVFEYTALKNNQLIEMEPSWQVRQSNYKNGILSADYVLTKSGYLGPEHEISHISSCREFIEESESGFSKVFQPLKTYRLKDDSIVTLYGRRAITPSFEIISSDPSGGGEKTIAQFVDKIELKEFQVEFSGAKQLKLTYRWRCLEEMSQNYKIFVHFKKDGEIIFDHDHTPAHDRYPTHLWRKSDLIFEEYIIDVPSEVPDGKYEVWIGVWNRLFRLPVKKVSTQHRKGAVKAGVFTLGKKDRK